MSGILFLLMLVAFVAIAHWAFSNDRGPEAGFKGLLAMTKYGEGEPSWTAPRAARWKQLRPPQPDGLRDRAEAPPPRWRQDLRRDRRSR